MALGATGAAIGGVAQGIGGVTNAIGINNSLNAKNDALSNLTSLAQQNPAGIFGTTPQYSPVDYTPLYQSDPGYAKTVNDVLKGDIYNLKPASDLTSQINAATTKDAMSRITSWDPSFLSSLNQLSANTNAALQGHLPYSDALQIAGGQGQLANTLGNAGGSAPQTAADLGLTRSSLMNQTGPGLLSQITSILNGVDPVSNQVNASSFLLSPSQGVQSAIGENQFGANFNMSQNLQEAAFGAMPDPQAQGLFNLASLQAGQTGTYNPAFGSGLSSLGSIFSNPYVNGLAQQNPTFGLQQSSLTGQYLPYSGQSYGYGSNQFLGNNGYVQGGNPISRSYF